MRSTSKLALYAAGLAAVLGVSVAIGAAADPTGLANAEPAPAEHGSEMPEGMVPGLAVAPDVLEVRRCAFSRSHGARPRAQECDGKAFIRA